MLKNTKILIALGGILLFLALPPFNLLPLGFISIIILYRGINQLTSYKEIFKNTYLYHLVYFIFSLYWISISLTVDLEKFWWLMPFTIVVLPAILALIPSFIMGFFAKVPTQTKGHKILLFASLWLISELIRGQLITNFPWNLSGYIFSEYDILRQVSYYITIYGCGFIIAAMSASIYHCYKDRIYQICVFCAFIILLVSGDHHLHRFMGDKCKTDEKFLKVALVQASIPQNEKWSEELFRKNLKEHIEISKQCADCDLYIWSEASLTKPIEGKNDLTKYITSFLPQNAKLITGGIKLIDNSYYPSLLVFDSKGNLNSYYTKKHLVPFGEYIPFNLHKSISNIISGLPSFSKIDDKINVLKVNEDLSFRSLICYEAIFPFEVNVGEKFDFIINVTNDAWFGNSVGPHQHFNMARFRALEQDRFLFRVANNGISAVIDNKGKVIEKTELNEKKLIIFNYRYMQ